MKFTVTLADRSSEVESEIKSFKEIGFEFTPWANRKGGFFNESIEVEIPTIQALMEFICKVGPVIIDDKRIEIYNGYIE